MAGRRAAPSLRLRARELRRRQTDAEGALWRRLRDRSLCGFKFRRQAPIGNYVVDFLCVDRNLVIELDGGSHASDSQRAYDERRSEALERLGYRVLRFWNTEVFENVDGVLQTILNEASGRQA